MLCPRIGDNGLSIRSTVLLGTKRTDMTGSESPTSGGSPSAGGAPTDAGGWDAGDIGQWHAQGYDQGGWQVIN